MSKPAAVGPRLSVMMFLQFFIWGSWYVTAPLYLETLGFGGAEFDWTYSVGPIAGMISPFFLGMVADRFFASERVLGVMHLLGAAAMYAAVDVMGGDEPAAAVINWLFFAHMLCYFPTLALTNTLALHNMTDAEKQFPLIRVFGTIGWIVAGFLLDQLGWAASRDMFYLTIGASVVLGLYSFTLPHTPPPAAGKEVSVRELIGADAFFMLKKRSFFVFMLSSFAICIPLAFYYQLAARCLGQADVENVATTMSFGQVSEIVFMLAMPLFFKRLGVKWMLVVGMAAWVLRYGLFALGAPQPNPVIWMLIIGVLLHGICYDFFFVTGQIYTEKSAPPAIRGQAQGMLVLFTLGLGMFIGAQAAGYVERKASPPEATALGDDVVKLDSEIKGLKKEVNTKKGYLDKENRALFEEGGPTEKQTEEASEDVQEILDLQTQIKELSDEQTAKSNQRLKLLDWQFIWLVPCGFAGFVMLFFLALFHDDTKAAPTEGEVANAFSENVPEDPSERHGGEGESS